MKSFGKNGAILSQTVAIVAILASPAVLRAQEGSNGQSSPPAAPAKASPQTPPKGSMPPREARAKNLVNRAFLVADTNGDDILDKDELSVAQGLPML